MDRHLSRPHPGAASERAALGLLQVMAVALLPCVVTWAAPLSPEAELGKALFFERSLSASGRLACASCHDPQNAYGPPRGAGPVMLGGAHLDRLGLRTVPSLRYLDHRPRFSRHQYATSGDDAEDVGPGGGFMWDGRADSLEAQALLPLLDSREMANRDVHELAARLRAAREAPRMRGLFGAAALRDDAHAAALAGRALARFELEDPSFHPYDSRYDAYLRGTERLSAQELRGLQLFMSPAKGNCAECHPAAPGPGGRPPQFTDHRFAALGIPRNRQLAANRDAGFHDLGLCGPLRSDLVTVNAEYCGLFRTPTLRNAGRRAHFFHNGRFSTLEDVVRFYAQRDLEPARWYSDSAGHVQRYDDLPSLYRVNVDHYDPPFDQRPGQVAVLSESEIHDLVAFLHTLDDRS